MDLREKIPHVRRVLIKCGTAVVSHSDGHIALSRVAAIVEQISYLLKAGKEVMLVTSGAVGVGKHRLTHQQLLGASVRAHISGEAAVELDSRACAAAGQSGLMALYETMFAIHAVQCAQILVTDADFSSASRRRNLHQTVEHLLALRVLPILNENDVITPRTIALVDEQNKVFWDNDSLASLVAVEMGFDLLLILSDVDGLYAVPPQDGIPQEPIHTYFPDSSYAIGAKSRVGRGGMQAKVDAAWGAVERGIKFVVVANGSKSDTIRRVMDGQVVGTLFTKQVPLNADGKRQRMPEEIAASAREASRALMMLDPLVRVHILEKIADGLIARQSDILNANAEDVALSGTLSITESSRSRLKLTRDKIATLAEGIRSVSRAAEPVGRVVERRELADKLDLTRVTCPIGVLLIVFESRPDVLPQVAALAIRTGNAVIMKGGKEAKQTLQVMHEIVVAAINEASKGQVPAGLVALVEGRRTVGELLKLDGVIDLCIPRGSRELVSSLKATTRIPVLGHADGICHVYVDQEAKLETAIRIVVDAKTDYPAACNAAETILLHSSFVADGRAARILQALSAAKVTVLGGPKAVASLSLAPAPNMSTEYGDNKVTLEIVDNVDEAISHINFYGSGHTDSIVTQNQATAEHFVRGVDSACAFANASTRFADGYRFGLGAEVGISTGRIHSRGPVGMEGLLTSKWMLHSNRPEGHTAGDFTSGGLSYTHKDLPIERARL